MKTPRLLACFIPALLFAVLFIDTLSVKAQTIAEQKVLYGLTGKNTTKRTDYKNSDGTPLGLEYWVGAMGWTNTYDWNSVFRQGSGFIDNSGNLTGAPEAGTMHGVGIQALHWADGTTGKGWQMVSGNGVNNNWYLRGMWGTKNTGWKKIVHDGNISTYAVRANNGIVDSNLTVDGVIAASKGVLISDGVNSGAVALVSGNASGSGYVSWYKSGATTPRLARLGYQDFTGNQNNLGLNLENSANFIIGGGNVGIGTANPGIYKLAVNGSMHSKSLYVDLAGWADYVFESDYRLAPLSEVEQHIKANKHLPGIPAAAEIAERGVKIGDMQSLLLSKIEEITLHQIAQEKAISALQAKNAKLRQQIGELQVASQP